MQNWFTSDWHLSHSTILMGDRGNRFANVGEHNEFILDTIFNMVNAGDNLYILGDIFWKVTTEVKLELFTKFKRKKINVHWIEGNHDKNFKHSAIVWKGQIREIKIEKQPIVLCHYPMLVWNRSHYNAWQLFGHIHLNDSTFNRMKQYPMIADGIMGKQLNVNIEFHDYKPWSFEEIKEYMDKRPNNWDFIDKTKEII